MHRGGGNARITSHNQDFNLIKAFNNLALWGENKFVSELKRTYKFQRGVNNKLDCHANQTRILSTEYSFVAGDYVRSTARNDVKCHTEDCSPKYRMVGKIYQCLTNVDKRLRNKCAIVCDLFPRPFGERVRERGYLAAFTLAEVLITLGIIGVVAAMTMPTLINDINNKANINKLKREYSLFQQAFQQIAADNDLEFKNAVADCPNSTKHACLKDIFKSKLKTVADCDSNDGDNLGKCFVQDKDAKKLNGESVPLYAGYFNQNTTSGLVLDDGASAAIWLDAMDCTNALSSVKQRCGWFVIDVNGPQKRPNTWGKDLFLFFLYADQIMPADENTTDYANYRDDCETGTNYGLTCASKYLFK